MTPLRIPLPVAILAASVLTLSACGTPPADLDLTLRHPSAQQRFLVQLDPPASGVPLQTLSAWTVRVASSDGQPVSRARVTVAGTMPQHGHGMPTQPRVTGEPSPGVYRIDGLKFSMAGWWQLRLAIRADEAEDTAEFNIVMTDAGLRR